LGADDVQVLDPSRLIPLGTWLGIRWRLSLGADDVPGHLL